MPTSAAVQTALGGRLQRQQQALRVRFHGARRHRAEPFGAEPDHRLRPGGAQQNLVIFQALLHQPGRAASPGNYNDDHHGPGAVRRHGRITVAVEPVRQPRAGLARRRQLRRVRQRFRERLPDPLRQRRRQHGASVRRPRGPAGRHGVGRSRVQQLPFGHGEPDPHSRKRRLERVHRQSPADLAALQPSRLGTVEGLAGIRHQLFGLLGRHAQDYETPMASSRPPTASPPRASATSP